MVGNSLASVLHLQRSLPARLQDLLQDVEQVRGTTGSRLQEIMGLSGLTGKEIKDIQEQIELIEKHVFGQKMSALLEMVRGCQTDFTKTQGGYDQAMIREESDLFFRHRVANFMKHFYKPIEMVHLNPDWVLAASTVGTTFCLSDRWLALAGGVGVLAAGTLAMKLYFFGPSADFQEIQKQADKNMKEVRRIKTMGKSMDQYLQTMQEDIKILQNCRMQFQLIKESLPCLAARCFDACSWDSSILSAALKEHDQPEAAAIFLKKNISGRAFIEVMKEQDLQDLGISDSLTLRRLLDLKAAETCKDTKTTSQYEKVNVTLFCTEWNKPELISPRKQCLATDKFLLKPVAAQTLLSRITNCHFLTA